MAKTPANLLPSLERLLGGLGERIRAARVRRNLTVMMVAERAGISLPTLRMVERGSASASLGAYAQVLLALNLAGDLEFIARDDDLGRKLQDLNLPERVRPKKRQGQLKGVSE